MYEMHKRNALIVDDEDGAINTLSGMIKEFCPQINLLGSCQTVTDALALIAEKKPDVVFLDIEIPPYGNGFDVVRLSKPNQFDVIFTTAYPQFAVKAINEIRPLAYLVKPFSLSELIAAVSVPDSRTQPAAAEPPISPAQKSLIVSDSRKGKFAIRLKDLLYCKADGNLTYLYVLRNGKVEKFTVSKSLAVIEEQLPEDIFMRVHHSYAVNFSYIDRFEPTGRNGMLHLLNNAAIPVSVKKMDAFEMKFLSFFGSV